MPRHALMVLGMHRSGTSVLTRVIGALGATLPADPLRPSADNPEGYHEPAGLVTAHDALLRAADSAWFDTRPLDASALPADAVPRMAAALRRSFGDAPFFVVKDPRTCRFVPLLRAALADTGARASAVIALRHPAEVAASLGRRDRMSAAYAGLLWARHMIEAERETRDMPRVIVAYGALLADWRDSVARIAALGDAVLPEEAAMGAILRPDLRHHTGPAAAATPPDLAALHAALLSLSARDDGAGRAAVDEAAARVEDAARHAAPLLEAEFLLQRLTSPNANMVSTDPASDRRRFAAAMQRLHEAPPRD